MDVICDEFEKMVVGQMTAPVRPFQVEAPGLQLSAVPALSRPQSEFSSSCPVAPPGAASGLPWK